MYRLGLIGEARPGMSGTGPPSVRGETVQVVLTVSSGCQEQGGTVRPRTWINSSYLGAADRPPERLGEIADHGFSWMLWLPS